MTISLKCHICHAPDEELYRCEDCDRPFCREHGQRGGDRQIQDVGAVDYPAICDVCRGVS